MAKGKAVDLPDDMQADWVLALELPDIPPAKVAGKINPEHYRVRLSHINLVAEAAVKRGGSIPFNVESLTKMIEREASMAGLDAASISDARSEGDKIIAAVNRLLDEGDKDTIFEQTDDDIDLLIKEMERVVEGPDMCLHLIQDNQYTSEMIAEKKTRGKKWLNRLQRVRRLRDLARYPIPPDVNVDKKISPALYAAWEASHILRYMLYVGRSSTITRPTARGFQSHIYRFGRHHARFAVDTWEARTGTLFENHQILINGRQPYKGVILIAPPGHGKPLCVETPILCGDGQVRRLGSIDVGDTVISHTGVARKVTEVHEQGVLPTIKIVTESGREVVAALDHPFLTPNGWKNAGDLKEYDILALRHEAKCEGSTEYGVDDCALAGYFVGDGQTTWTNKDKKGLAANITCADEETGKNILRVSERLGFRVTVSKGSGLASRYSFRSETAAPRIWLQDIGLAGHDSYNKRVPYFVYKAGNDGIAAFIAAYFECDGTINKKGKGRDDACVEFYSVNRDLLQDIQHLLLRLGIHCNIREKKGRYKDAPHKSWRLSLSSMDAVSRFASRIPVLGKKRERLDEWARQRTKFNEEYIADRIVRIEQHAPTKCRCLTVDVDHTFLANDIVVHNSEFASHYLALEINLRPSTQALYIHAIADKAQEQKAHVARLFTKESAAGRRNTSIWNHQLDKTDNNKTKMRLKLPERSKSPTVTSTGIMSAQLGADTNIQILDDIVPQSDVDQPTERDRRFKILSGTFGTRQRGQDTFRVVIGTFWHHDDALSRLWKIGDTSDLYVRSRQKTGGPNTSPPFKPLWPEVFPAQELRRRFDEMNHNISLWSANYMGNPITEEARLIKTLAYFDPDSVEHMDFMAGARCYVTVDPTATNKEKADKAGLVYVAVGDVQTDYANDGNVTTGFMTKARIVDYKEIHVNQVELADTVAQYSMARPVHQVHVETRSGYHATADILQNKYNIEAVRHDPGPKNKEQRLKACAGIIDNSLQGLQALVEFPGVPHTDGKLGPDEKHKPFYNQFLDFGYAPDDHCVDAVTQLLNYLLRSGILVAGGSATISVGKFPEQRNPRMAEELDQYLNPRPEGDKAHEDWSWFAQRSEAV